MHESPTIPSDFDPVLLPRGAGEPFSLTMRQTQPFEAMFEMGEIVTAICAVMQAHHLGSDRAEVILYSDWRVLAADDAAVAACKAAMACPKIARQMRRAAHVHYRDGLLAFVLAQIPETERTDAT